MEYFTQRSSQESANNRLNTQSTELGGGMSQITQNVTLRQSIIGNYLVDKAVQDHDQLVKE